ncbi:MAG: pilus assembly protein [Lachnospiraceae bacterium]|nr:pilus assembly protein [Lachnospiraceae bacterium]
MVRKKFSSSGGEVMLESVLVLAIVLIMACALLGMGIFFYQQAVLQISANEAASYIAAGYKYAGKSSAGKDLTDTRISEQEIRDVRVYRTLFKLNNRNGIWPRVRHYYDDRLSLFSLNPAESGLSQPMSIRLITDNIGRIHVEVTLKTRISSAAGSLLYRLGIYDSPEPVLQATGRAEVLDITGYGSDVRFLNYVCNKINDSDDLKNMKTIYVNGVSIYDSTLDMAEKAEIVAEGIGQAVSNIKDTFAGLFGVTEMDTGEGGNDGDKQETD